MCTNFVNRCCAALEIVTVQSPAEVHGLVASISGMTLQVRGVVSLARIGDRLTLCPAHAPGVAMEVVGFTGDVTEALAFGALDHIGHGCRVAAALPPRPASVCVTDHLLGRIIDPAGLPLDGGPPLPTNGVRRRIDAPPLPAASRDRLGRRLHFGIRALDMFLPMQQGQRLGIFAGSGVGKSTLLASLAEASVCDVAVIALVGERGREVREFVEDILGSDGLPRAVVVVATSDLPPMIRRDAALAATTIAEYFRNAGRHVLLLIDSITRFAMALREIALSGGEAPGLRGYPPSVLSALPRLLERPGPGVRGQAGSITALLTVLVEADDVNDPIADAIRSILDGHIVLDRRLAERGSFPPIDVLRSISRTAAQCAGRRETALARRARGILALSDELSDLVRLGAYRPGTDPKADEALRLAPAIRDLIQQPHGAPAEQRSPLDILETLFGGEANA